MKKIGSKLLVALLLVAMMSVNFLSVDALAGEISAIEVTLDFPDTIESGKIGDLFNAISVSSGDTTISHGVYDGIQNFVSQNGDPFSLETDTDLEKGNIYHIRIELQAPTGDSFKYVNETYLEPYSGDYFGEVSCTPNCSYNTKMSFVRKNDGKWDKFALVIDYPYGVAIPQAASTEREAVAIIDRDLFKSEAPSKTVIAADSIGAKSFFDMKVHAADAQTQANQKLLAQNLVGANTKILVTEIFIPEEIFLFQRMVH